MDADHFDALTRVLVSHRSRRRLAAATGALLGSLLARLPFGARHDVLAKNKKRKGKKKKKKKPDCPEGQRPCQDQCIPNEGCCSDSECPVGECAACRNHQCVLNGPFCTATYGPCYYCSAESHTCLQLPETEPEDSPCGPCRFCRAGNCVDCSARGECATCQSGKCRAHHQTCMDAYGPCHRCTLEVSGNFTCFQTEVPCGQNCCTTGLKCCGGQCIDVSLCCTNNTATLPCKQVCCGADSDCCTTMFTTETCYPRDTTCGACKFLCPLDNQTCCPVGGTCCSTSSGTVHCVQLGQQTCP